MSAIFYSRYDQVLDFMYYFVGTAAGVANLFHDVYAGSKVGEVITVFHQYTVDTVYLVAFFTLFGCCCSDSGYFGIGIKIDVSGHGSCVIVVAGCNLQGVESVSYTHLTLPTT